MMSILLEKQIDWQNIFSPGSIAVIGASNTVGSWGYAAIKGLVEAGGRQVYAVNPKAAEVYGIKAYPKITDIIDPIDFAVIVVAVNLVPGVLRDCVTKNVKAAIIITSGFAETGEQGQNIENELKLIAKQGHIHFIGPNSMGHADTRSRLTTFGQATPMKIGSVAVLSQSGSMCLKIVRALSESGIDVSKYISTGNEADLHLEDYLEYLVNDNDTKIITAYVEGLREGRRFFNLAKAITTRKPIVVVKVGGTEISAKAVMSHTGALAGADSIYDAAFKQSGVIRVEDEDELCDVVSALLNSPLPKKNRIGILSIGGGPGALAAESCEKEGLTISTLEESTLLKLDKLLPPRWPRKNPVDMSGPTTSDFSSIADMLWALMDDKNTDAVFLLAPIVVDRHMLVNRLGLNEEQIKAYREKEKASMESINQKIKQTGKPIYFLWQSRASANDTEISTMLRSNKIIVYNNARRAARVLKHLTSYRCYLDINLPTP